MIKAYSADSHVTEPGDCYIDRIDPKFRDRAPVAVLDETMGATILIDNGRNRLPYGMVAAAGRPWDQISPFNYVPWEDLHAGGWDPQARLAEQDRDGVALEVLYPSVGMMICNHPDADYKKACFDAYNLWIAEFQAVAPDRFVGLGQTALRTVDEGIADLERIKHLGLRGVMLPGYASCHDDGDYDDPRWDPFWRAAGELGLPLSFHILTSGNDQPTNPQFRGPKLNSFLGIIRGCQDIVGTLVFGGVFDRVPGLQVVCVEADAGWVPHWMYRADHAYDRHRNWLSGAPLERRPSEYVRDNVFVTFQDDRVAFQVTHLMNHERLMWASDHPHSDATFPDSQAVIAQHTAALDPQVRDDILWRNCARLYGLDT
ncbi:MAG: amidohydrolase family protein [Acidimicrobiia bacterium]|jgi:predicted TIM-barrel fold metal-dependent hydrolase